MSKVQIGLFLVLVMLAVLTAACGGSSTPASATATTAPTATSAATSAAPAAQATEAPPPTLGPGRFTDAFNKMSTAKQYRFEIVRTGTGVFSPLNSLPTPEAGTPTPSASEPDISIKGTINGADSDLLMGGLMSSMGGGPSQGIQVITVGDKSYIKGPIPMMGATEDKWYEMPAGMASSIMPAVDPATLFGSLTQTGMDPNAFNKTGNESVDTQSCDIYAGDKAVALKAFQDLFKNGQNTNFVIDTADARFWLCGDGYIHKTLLNLEAHTTDNGGQKGTFNLTLHVYDFGNTTAIAAPSGSVPLQIPGAPTGNETPGAQPPAVGTPTP